MNTIAAQHLASPQPLDALPRRGDVIANRSIAVLVIVVASFFLVGLVRTAAPTTPPVEVTFDVAPDGDWALPTQPSVERRASDATSRDTRAAVAP